MELWSGPTEITGFFFAHLGRIQVQELFSRLAEKDRDSDSLVVWLGLTCLEQIHQKKQCQIQRSASWKLPYLSNEDKKTLVV